MKELKTNQLKEVKGGAINWGAIAGFSALSSFLIGLVDGFINPKKCNG